uniref:HDC18571 n=1 Tax=Drosophila melanogaster TaxID=7227 RepID=Q6IIE3_DROME|nr:TPA_inf: HDC18571 [Drosophila melanogaster]
MLLQHIAQILLILQLQLDRFGVVIIARTTALQCSKKWVAVGWVWLDVRWENGNGDGDGGGDVGGGGANVDRLITHASHKSLSAPAVREVVIWLFVMRPCRWSVDGGCVISAQGVVSRSAVQGKISCGMYQLKTSILTAWH